MSYSTSYSPSVRPPTSIVEIKETKSSMTPDEKENVAMRLYVDLKKLESENFPPEEHLAVFVAIVSNLLDQAIDIVKDKTNGI